MPSTSANANLADRSTRSAPSQGQTLYFDNPSQRGKSAKLSNKAETLSSVQIKTWHFNTRTYAATNRRGEEDEGNAVKYRGKFKGENAVPSQVPSTYSTEFSSINRRVGEKLNLCSGTRNRNNTSAKKTRSAQGSEQKRKRNKHLPRRKARSQTFPHRHAHSPHLSDGPPVTQNKFSLPPSSRLHQTGRSSFPPHTPSSTCLGIRRPRLSPHALNPPPPAAPGPCQRPPGRASAPPVQGPLGGGLPQNRQSWRRGRRVESAAVRGDAHWPAGATWPPRPLY